MSDTRCYIFDLCLSVPFPVGNELRAPDSTPVDVQVKLGQAPRSLPNAIHRFTLADAGIRVEVDDRADVLLHTATARYYIVGGHTVLVDADSILPEHGHRAMVLHHCVPILLNQRGDFVLHANVIVTSHGAIALSGSSGSGKSTLHAALLTRGMAMLSDDVAVLRSRENGYDVLPGTRRYTMMADAWERMQPPADQIIPLSGPRKKVALWAPTNLHHHQPAPLFAIYLIEAHADGEIVAERLQGIAAFQSLQTQAYLPLGAMAIPQHIRAFSELVDCIAVYRIRRPVNRWTVDELADIVLSSDPLFHVPVHD